MTLTTLIGGKAVKLGGQNGACPPTRLTYSNTSLRTRDFVVWFRLSVRNRTAPHATHLQECNKKWFDDD
jgi:hypothetical protein